MTIKEINRAAEIAGDLIADLRSQGDGHLAFQIAADTIAGLLYSIPDR